jgi:uncharacterized protein (DUF58 family)
VSRLKERWQAWWKSRHPPRDEQRLTQRNVYIVPTRVGVAFLLTQGVLLVASINDQLSLGYALTFLLAGCGLASMHTTHGNLSGLLLTLQPPEPGHQDTDLPLRIRLHNVGRARYGLGLRLADAEVTTLAWADVPAQGHQELVLTWRAPRRGHLELPVLRIETRFPLGLFIAWSYWQPASRQWVYPAVEQPPPPLPSGQPRRGEGPPGPPRASAGGDEFHGVRPWREGDGLRSVLWKKAAQASHEREPLWVRDWASPPPSQDQWLDAADTAGLDGERRWQRLAAWVLLADESGQDWGLRGVGEELPLGQGAGQRAAALQRLALA